MKDGPTTTRAIGPLRTSPEPTRTNRSPGNRFPEIGAGARRADPPSTVPNENATRPPMAIGPQGSRGTSANGRQPSAPGFGSRASRRFSRIDWAGYRQRRSRSTGSQTGRRSALESSPALADTPPEIGRIGCAKSKANYRSAPIVERPFPKSTSPDLIRLRPACR